MIMGCDEAGRGCLIGPLVIAGVTFQENTLKKLRQIGVRDSKKLTPTMRYNLYPRINRLARTVSVYRIQPSTVDRYVFQSIYRKKNLNTLEAEVIAKIISKVKPTIAYVDCPDPRPDMFAALIKSMSGVKTKVVCEHKADEMRIQVSASSIVAKVVRDRAISKLKRTWGDFGSGYPSDDKTRFFLKQAIARGDKPSIIRWSWKTVKNIAAPCTR